MCLQALPKPNINDAIRQYINIIAPLLLDRVGAILLNRRAITPTPMNDYRIKEGLAKVVFKGRINRNGKDYIWIRLSRAWVERLARYWRNQSDFYYMKVYDFNRKTRVVGRQLVAIGLTYIKY